MTILGQAPPAIAVVGCGAWGRNHVRTLAALGALRAVHDADSNTATETARSAQVVARGLEEILEDPEIGGIVIATPDATHADLATRALDAGKHVLVEKPLATSVSDAIALAALAKRKERTLMAGHILLYHSGFLQLRRMVQSGSLGDILHIASKRLHMARGAPRHALWDLAPHDVSMVLAITGRLPSTIRAQAATPLADAPPQQVNLLLTFEDGPSADIALSAIHPVKLHQLTVAGTDAFGIFEDSRDWKEKVFSIRPGLGAEVPGAAPFISEPSPLQPEEPLLIEIKEFISAMDGGSPPPSGTAEAVDVIRVIGAAQESLDSGTTVILDNTPHDTLET